MAKLFNRAWMTVSGTPGTGTITLLAAFSNAYLTFAEAGVANTNVVSYVIEDGNDFEVGIGTYTTAGTTLSRDTVTASKIAGVAGTTKLTLTSAATVFLCPRKEDLGSLSETNTWAVQQTFSAAVNLTSGQIAFPATAVPSADANTLDDYEEGTWTPAFTFVTPGNLSIAYTARAGTYTKMGNIVNLTWFIVTSTFTHTTASGNANITGLPFTESSFGVSTLIWQGITTTCTQVMCNISGTTMEFWGSTTAAAITVLGNANFPTAGTLSMRAAGQFDL